MARKEGEAVAFEGARVEAGRPTACLDPVQDYRRLR